MWRRAPRESACVFARPSVRPPPLGIRASGGRSARPGGRRKYEHSRGLARAKFARFGASRGVCAEPRLFSLPPSTLRGPRGQVAREAQAR
eukprot:scaffold5543_cov196-Prasinococcus_capsulatus_cf.AAC.1